MDRDLNEKILPTNKNLKTLLASEKINFITHNNITQTHLNREGFHLNKRGDAAPAYNLSRQYVMVSSIFNYDLVKSDDTEPHEFEATSKAGNLPGSVKKPYH